MQFFKTSYETRPGISALRRASRWYLCVNASLFKEKKKHYFAETLFEQSWEKKRREKNLREHSKKHLIRNIDHVVLANELFIHPYFLPFFYDRLYTRARVCRFQYNATEIIRPIVMKRKWKKFLSYFCRRHRGDTERSSVYFSPRKFFLVLYGSEIFYTRRRERETSPRSNVKTRTSNDFNIT